MKKFLASFSLVALCALSANAQDTANASSTTAPAAAPASIPQPNAKPQTERMMREFRRERLSQKTAAADEKYANAREMREHKEERRFRGMDVASDNEPKANNAINEKYRTTSLEEKKQMLETREKKVDEKIADRKAKHDSATPEQKARMDAMEKLTPEQKEAAHKEKERHRAEMKRITGIDW